MGGIPHIPGQGVVPLKLRLSFMSSPQAHSSGPLGLAASRRGVRALCNKRPQLIWGSSGGHRRQRLVGKEKEGDLPRHSRQQLLPQQHHRPGMRGHPEAVLITLPERLEQPGSCRLPVQMGTKSVSSLLLQSQSAQGLDPGQHCSPEAHIPTRLPPRFMDSQLQDTPSWDSPGQLGTWPGSRRPRYITTLEQCAIG